MLAVSKGKMLAVSATMRKSVEKKHSRPLLLQKNPDSKRREKFFEREISQKPQSFWKGIPKTVQRLPHWKLYESIM